MSCKEKGRGVEGRREGGKEECVSTEEGHRGEGTQ